MNDNDNIIPLPIGTVTVFPMHASFDRGGCEIGQSFEIDVTVNRIHYEGRVFVKAYRYNDRHSEAQFFNLGSVHRGALDWGNVTPAADQAINDALRDAGLLDAFNNAITDEWLESEIRREAERALRAALRQWVSDVDMGSYRSGVNITSADLVDILGDLDSEAIIKGA